MKKSILAFTIILSGIVLTSCSVDNFTDETQSPQACCGNKGEILPPPPKGEIN
jgi:hypothetical protein